MCGSPLISILPAEDDVQVVRYSLKTKTLFCPANRTSWTCPSAFKRIAVYCDFCSRSSQRPSLSATVFLPFCTVALFPSMESRYSPACNEAFPTFAAWVRLIVCVNGFAKAGTVIAKATKSAAMRYVELIFMRVTFPFRSTENEPQGMAFKGS
jgi:hypothetical protein